MCSMKSRLLWYQYLYSRNKRYWMMVWDVFLNEGASRGAFKSLAWWGRKRENVSVRMVWISFGALPCRKKRTLWRLMSPCWNCTRPWYASSLVSFLVRLRTYQHPGICLLSVNSSFMTVLCFSCVNSYTISNSQSSVAVQNHVMFWLWMPSGSIDMVTEYLAVWHYICPWLPDFLKL